MWALRHVLAFNLNKSGKQGELNHWYKVIWCTYTVCIKFHFHSVELSFDVTDVIFCTEYSIFSLKYKFVAEYKINYRLYVLWISGVYMLSVQTVHPWRNLVLDKSLWGHSDFYKWPLKLTEFVFFGKSHFYQERKNYTNNPKHIFLATAVSTAMAGKAKSKSHIKWKIFHKLGTR